MNNQNLQYNFDISELTGRSQVVLNSKAICHTLSGKTVLVTGGGGSIGSAICSEVIKYNPKKLVILDIYENGAYELYCNLTKIFPNQHIDIVIANICDFEIIKNIFEKYRPEVVFHAAAHKHVPLMEKNCAEAVKNNVFGTCNVMQCSTEHNCEKFVLISSDKAVNPTSVMGATKRICEMLISSCKRSGFSTVRLGNVLASNGSVVPLFQKQIAEGGPVTITHPEITRFFMTIPEAASLVLQAASYAKGGEIFVLDMGSPVKIYDLAKKMILLSGLKPDVDIKIEFIGLRPGEKLYEELLLSEEGLTKTAHSKIFVGKPIDISFEELEKKLGLLKNALDKDNETIKRIISDIVPTYTIDSNTQ